jgi:UDP-N-acetylmuramate--alanine ligase
VYGRIRHIHFVGIGGTGMSGIAEVLLNMGYQVSGSDLSRNEATERLERLGGTIHEGHSEEQVLGADVVVVSSAVRPDNPEWHRALQEKIPVIPRAEMLAELMRLKFGIAVSGAHGKTTTSSMIASVLSFGGLDPTLVVGGRVRALRSGARLGTGKFLVAEADESDGSFLQLSPTITIITTIDEEHLDFYRDLEQIEEAFVTFAQKVPFYGVVIACADDPNVRAVLPRITKRVMTYGLCEEADLRAVSVTTQGMASFFTVEMEGERLGTVELRVPGLHNVQNALAAIAVGHELGIPFGAVRNALSAFEGVSRRFEIRSDSGGVVVVDDYGHHPTEIAAVLAAARQVHSGRVVAVFQPHRYTRTAALWERFGPAFREADVVLVTEIYAAGERPIEGVNGSLIAEAVRATGHRDVRFIAERDALVDHLRGVIRPGDMVITLGAGDIWKVGSLVAPVGAPHPVR